MNNVNKILYLIVEISQLLSKYNVTYNEAEEILKSLTSEFKQQREEKEYATYDDYFAKRKTYHADNDIVQQLNHVDEIY